MPLINYKVYFELNWIEDCILSTAGNSAKFEITDTKLHVSIVTLTTKGSANLTKQLSKGFKRCFKNLYGLLNASFQGVKRLFALAYFVAAGAENDEASIKNYKNYFLSRGEIKNYNVLIDGRNFYDQPIND